MPTPLPAPYFVAASAPAARLVGLDAADLAHEDIVAVFTGNHVPPRSQPLAAVYSGHQYARSYQTEPDRDAVPFRREDIARLYERHAS